jgi:hypothetical protein
MIARFSNDLQHHEVVSVLLLEVAVSHWVIVPDSSNRAVQVITATACKLQDIVNIIQPIEQLKENIKWKI